MHAARESEINSQRRNEGWHTVLTAPCNLERNERNAKDVYNKKDSRCCRFWILDRLAAANRARPLVLLGSQRNKKTTIPVSIWLLRFATLFGESRLLKPYSFTNIFFALNVTRDRDGQTGRLCATHDAGKKFVSPDSTSIAARDVSRRFYSTFRFRGIFVEFCIVLRLHVARWFASHDRNGPAPRPNTRNRGAVLESAVVGSELISLEKMKQSRSVVRRFVPCDFAATWDARESLTRIFLKWQSCKVAVSRVELVPRYCPPWV